MKFIASLFVTVLVAGSVAHAEEVKSTTTPAAENSVSTITGKDKKVRKKKVEMCGECGKPESECECHGHKSDDKKKAEEAGK